MKRQAACYTALIWLALALWMAALLCLPLTAFGQITVAPENPVYTPIPVIVKTTVPEGAQIKSGPGLVWPAGINKIETSPGNFIVCAPPGEYTITYKVSWLHIEPITFVDGSGKTITIQSYLGSGDVDEKATFKIVGGEVPPVPPPTPVGQKWAIIWEPAERTAANGNLYIQLRAKLQQDLLILRPQKLPPGLQKIRDSLPANQALPALTVLVRRADGSDQVLKTVSQPTTVEAVEQEVQP